MDIKNLRLIALIIIVPLIACLLFNQLYSKTKSYQNGVVVSDSEIATKAGLQILKEGGNAIDAAVTVAFVLAVVFPQAGNIGGGGFLVYRKADGTVSTINYREMAPLKSYKNMYLDDKGNIIKDLSTKGPLAAGVPGTIAGIYLAWKKHGSLKWKKLITPAINLAENGFIINKELANDLKDYENDFKIYKSSASIFLDNKLHAKKVNTLLVQKDLAKTLRMIANEGADGFYKGKFAMKFVAEIQKNGGIITTDDLASYTAKESKPLSFNYQNYRIHTMALPSSGGILLQVILRILEKENLSKYKHNSAEHVHLITEILKRAYAERSEHLGDPSFYKVPINYLLSDNFSEKIRNDINRKKPTPSSEIKPTIFFNNENYNTTHFSIVDKKGNAVSNTYTLNGTFGSFYVVEGTGILLNNEMDDFSIKPGIPNMYGLIGSQANSIEPHKQMLSSMTPTIIEKDNKLFAVLGSPGGSRIITSVLQVILNLTDFRMSIDKAVSAKRFHHQWLPDILFIEKNFPHKTESKLIKMGYKINKRSIGRVNAIYYDAASKSYIGVADPRASGNANGY